MERQTSVRLEDGRMLLTHLDVASVLELVRAGGRVGLSVPIGVVFFDADDVAAIVPAALVAAVAA